MGKRQVSESELEQSLQTHIRNSNGNIVIIGGHYALDSNCFPGIQPTSLASFGAFPLYTFALACSLVNFAKDEDKSVNLALLVDDHSQMYSKNWYMKNDLQSLQVRQVVEKYFADFEIPVEYKEIMRQHGISHNDFMFSEYGFAFQESKYREQFAQQAGLYPGCAGEYRLILEEIAGKGGNVVIGLIPLRCQGPTCNAMNQYNLVENNPPIKIVHTYFSTNEIHDTPEDMFNEMREGVPIFTQGYKRSG